ncbi:MAG: hypothetical protein KME26_09560 [Oscillatoria princeps RMCB-10]|nr:hypothetical protein [Oscillatoria princeps RMCB-10]
MAPVSVMVPVWRPVLKEPVKARPLTGLSVGKLSKVVLAKKGLSEWRQVLYQEKRGSQ